MNDGLPSILVTGASGFIGRHFVIAACNKFRLFCIARRSQKEAGIPQNDNIHWLQADITKWQNLLSAAQYIRNHGGADYVLHLAGYYDLAKGEEKHSLRSILILSHAQLFVWPPYTVTGVNIRFCICCLKPGCTKTD